MQLKRLMLAALRSGLRRELGRSFRLVRIGWVLLVASFGGLTHAQACRSLELFARAAIRPRRAPTSA